MDEYTDLSVTKEQIKEWRCFFCDEVFTRREDATLHFGCDEACEADEVACKMLSKPQETVIGYIRDLESEVRSLQEQLHNETHPLMTALYEAADIHFRELRQAEERGYAKGVADMKAQGYCSEPDKHK